MHRRLVQRILTGFVTAACAIALAGCGESESVDATQQVGPNPVLAKPTPGLLADMKIAEVVGWQDGQTPTVPDNLKVTAYAKDLAHPRTVHTLPNGDVLVVQSRGPSGKPMPRPKDLIRSWVMSWAKGGGSDKESNLITLLRDTNRDGIVDARHDLLTGLHSPFGVAFVDDTLYVAEADAIVSYPYQLGQTSITVEPTILTPLPGGPINHHWTKDLAVSPDRRFLYASVGSNSNVAERGLEAEKGRAAIWQVDRETGAARVFASGLRNPNGLTIHPTTGVLWTVVNERDELGSNLVPDYLTSVREGGFYGWPWSYYGGHVDERVHPRRPEMVKKALAPDYALGSHVAALGLAFSHDSAMPPQYARGAFVGQHGSWNRSVFSGYKVIFLPFENGVPAGMPVDVATGFLDGDQARGRPVGVAIDGTGALLIADDAGNTVWRVASADGSITTAPIGSDRLASSAPSSAPDRESRRQGQALPPTEPGQRTSAPSPTEVAPAVLPRPDRRD